MPRCHGLVFVLVVASIPAVADAQPRIGKPSWGYFAEMGVGATGFLGETQRYAAVGPTFGVRAGKDLTSWFAIGGLVATSMHEATVPPPPEQEYFQLYTVAAEARFTARPGRVALFVEGGVGVSVINTNVLDRVQVTLPDEHVTLVYHAGGGLAWHTQNRHFSIGLAGDWTMYPGFGASQAVAVRLYLRYTK